MTNSLTQLLSHSSAGMRFIDDTESDVNNNMNNSCMAIDNGLTAVKLSSKLYSNSVVIASVMNKHTLNKSYKQCSMADGSERNNEEELPVVVTISSGDTGDSVVENDGCQKKYILKSYILNTMHICICNIYINLKYTSFENKNYLF